MLVSYEKQLPTIERSCRGLPKATSRILMLSDKMSVATCAAVALMNGSESSLLLLFAIYPGQNHLPLDRVGVPYVFLPGLSEPATDSNSLSQCLDTIQRNGGSLLTRISPPVSEDDFTGLLSKCEHIGLILSRECKIEQETVDLLRDSMERIHGTAWEYVYRSALTRERALAYCLIEANRPSLEMLVHHESAPAWYDYVRSLDEVAGKLA
jgi:hypothetical protein